MKKKMLIVMMCLVLAAGFVSAQAIEIETGTLLGFHGETAVGANVDVKYLLNDRFGIKLEANWTAADVSFSDGGMNVRKNYVVYVPVMAWYEQPFGNISVGAGAGLAPVFDDSFDVCLAGGLNASYRFNDAWAAVLGVAGNLDCFPTLDCTDNGDFKTYILKAPDFARNALAMKIGASYRIGL